VLFVEVTSVPSRDERLILTGMLGDVMRESAQAALSYVRSYATTARAKVDGFGVDPKLFENATVHVHVPAGAIPKDGPSAGITMMTALASLASGRPVRSDLAMTGELTLRGKVLPIGGVKEKVLAAHRAGIKRVLIPERNKADLDEVPAEIKNDLEFILIGKMDQLLDAALEEKLQPKPESAVAPTPN
jgi:ATP-dependent Lon protease